MCGYKKGSAVKISVGGLTKHETVLPDCMHEGKKEHYTDKDGRIYLSSAGIKEVTVDELVIPKSTTRHVGGDYAHDETEHWIACACGAELNRKEHSFGENGVCEVCGFRKTEAESVTSGPPAERKDEGKNESKNESESRFPWWIIIIVCIALAVIVLTVIIISSGKKKGKEKESEAARNG